MGSLKNEQHLAAAIENLVDEYISALRVTAEFAIHQAFSKSKTSRRPKTRGAETSAGSKRISVSARRPAEVMAELSERLYAEVSARSGESMAVYADAVGVSVRELHRPMSKLKAEGRVRSVGERNATRYFVALGRRSRGSET
jgi:predicted transcriptional regulator